MRTRLAWGVALGATAIFVYSAFVPPTDELAFALQFVFPFTALCALGPILKPANRTGWYLLGLIAFSVAIPWFLEIWVAGTPIDGGRIGRLRVVSALVPVLSAIGGVSGMLMLAGLPDGEVPRSGRPAIWTMGAVLVLLQVAEVVARPTTSMSFVGGPVTSNPLFVESLRWLSDPLRVDPIAVSRLIAIPAAMFLGFMVAIQRFSRADERTRRRMRWVFYGAGISLALGITVVALDAEGPPPANEAIAALRYLPLFALPASVALAVAEPRWLIERDEQARRSAVYTMLSLAILVAYVAIPSALGLTASRALPIEVTLVAAVGLTAAIHPISRWLRRQTDRAVFGTRGSPIEVILDEVAGGTGELAPAVADAIRNAFRLRWVRCDLDDTNAVSGVEDGPPEQVLALEHDGESYGTIACGPGIGRPLTDVDWEMLRTLAAAITLALTNARLATRIVQAQEAERRRIERNIHDGAQQDIVAMIARLGVARAKLARADLTDADLVEIQDTASRVVDDLHELSQGIRPAVLTDGGLVMAVRERCSRAPFPIEVSTSIDDTGLTDDVAGAAYFFVAEGVANVLKHAGGANRVRVGIHESDGLLEVSVADDGAGFSGTIPPGGGLAGLRDRLSAIGGTLTIQHPASGGTTVTARIPAGARR